MQLRRLGSILVAAVLLVGGRPLSAQGDALARAASHFAVLDGVRIHYKTLGTGRTAVVLVHGWACDLTVWRGQVPVLEGRGRILAVDLPGNGRSDKPATTYSMDFFARAVNAAVAAAQIDQVVLVGHSMGTPVIRQFYRLFPGKVKALVVVDGALKAPDLDSAGVERMVKDFSGPNLAATFDQMIAPMFPGEALAGMRRDVLRMAGATPAHVVTGSIRAMFDPAIWRDDPIGVPVLAVMAKGPSWPPAYRAYVSRLVPGVDYHELDGVHHFVMLERPDLFNPLLTDFLKTVGVR